ncbi:MAG: GTPase ObgE [Candidatus Neomarinimicrobiota bacterium]
MFIDFTEVELSAGKGGKGSVHFRREKFVPKGGPDGGDGGRGGHVIFRTDSNLHTLQDIRYHKKYNAEDGSNGGGSRKTGRCGRDIIIKVPVGTLIREKISSNIIADLTENNFSFIICKGGKGGHGNIRYKTSTNQAPRRFQPGEEGENGLFEIELKVLADVGLVGLPNAGKSTLLSKISSARPKIANYPFTTLEPKLGIVKYEEYSSFVMADIPGLIEGASKGKGLGHQFLRHIERNKVLLFLIDSQDPNPNKTYRTLKNEIYQYNSDLKIKPIVICQTKIDLEYQESNEWDNIEEEIIKISSLSGKGINTLIKKVTAIIY